MTPAMAEKVRRAGGPVAEYTQREPNGERKFFITFQLSLAPCWGIIAGRRTREIRIEARSRLPILVIKGIQLETYQRRMAAITATPRRRSTRSRESEIPERRTTETTNRREPIAREGRPSILNQQERRTNGGEENWPPQESKYGEVLIGEQKIRTIIAETEEIEHNTITPSMVDQVWLAGGPVREIKIRGQRGATTHQIRFDTEFPQGWGERVGVRRIVAYIEPLSMRPFLVIRGKELGRQISRKPQRIIECGGRDHRRNRVEGEDEEEDSIDGEEDQQQARTWPPRRSDLGYVRLGTESAWTYVAETMDIGEHTITEQLVERARQAGGPMSEIKERRRDGSEDHYICIMVNFPHMWKGAQGRRMTKIKIIRDIPTQMLVFKGNHLAIGAERYRNLAPWQLTALIERRDVQEASRHTARMLRGPDPLTGDMQAWIGSEDIRIETEANFDSGTSRTIASRLLIDRVRERQTVPTESIKPTRFWLADSDKYLRAEEKVWIDVRMQTTQTRVLVLRSLCIHVIQGESPKQILIGRDTQRRLGIEPAIAAGQLCDTQPLKKEQDTIQGIKEEEEALAIGRQETARRAVTLKRTSKAGGKLHINRRPRPRRIRKKHKKPEQKSKWQTIKIEGENGTKKVLVSREEETNLLSGLLALEFMRHLKEEIVLYTNPTWMKETEDRKQVYLIGQTAINISRRPERKRMHKEKCLLVLGLPEEQQVILAQNKRVSKTDTPARKTKTITAKKKNVCRMNRHEEMTDDRRLEWQHYEDEEEEEENWSSEDEPEEEADQRTTMTIAHSRLTEDLEVAGITDDDVFNRFHELLDSIPDTWRTSLKKGHHAKNVRKMKVTLKHDATPSKLPARSAGETANDIVHTWAMAGIETDIFSP
eukprot:GHVU01143411.1.p1 GENE.GHVU01143411.1~~GHVU01143411.1.p1  ORF type:complete len:1036 (+),score=170.91 GHVU01143411.1:465-3110(+)